MDLLSQIIIVALFSLHQYIPADKMDAKYFNSTVEPSTLEFQTDSFVVISAAHQTCRFFFKEAQRELDFSEPELINFFYSIIDQHKDSISKAKSSSDNVKETLRKVCQEEFNVRSFTSNELKSIESLIKTEVAVLKKTDLESLGQIGFFGKTNLYDRHGTSLGSLFPLTENWLSYSEISPNVSKALIAAEDQGFLKHEGVDLSSMIRMAYQMKSSDAETLSGGSTLTMQLLKNFYFSQLESKTGNEAFQNSRYRTLLRKIREWFWAKPFEEFHAKNQPGRQKKFILENYLNLMDFGPGIRGIDQAAKVFFKKNAIDLDVAEAAFVATLFKAPNRYAVPSNYEKYTQKRRTYVLDQMKSLQWEESLLEPISSEEFTTASQKALPQWSRSNDKKENTDTTLYLEGLAKEFILNQVKASSETRAIESELVSTIDLELQTIVQTVVKKRIDSYDQKRFTPDRINPARDDRSRIAEIIDVDVSDRALIKIEEALEALKQQNKEADLIIYLGKDLNDESNKNKNKYYIYQENKIVTTVDFLNKYENSILPKNKSAGDIVAFWTNPPGCISESQKFIDDLLNSSDDDTQKLPPEKLVDTLSSCLKLLENEPLITEINKTLKYEIIISLLERMNTNSPRSNIQAAYLEIIAGQERLLTLGEAEDDTTQKPLFITELSTNFLNQNHQDLLRNKVANGEFKDGHVFWVAPNGENSSVFHLETPKLQASAVVIDSNNGEVLAQFGGYDPASSRFFDRSRVAKRPPGSTLKPWLYYMALNKGFDLNSAIQNEGVTFRINNNSVYRPENFSRGSGSAQVDLTTAFINSWNKAAVGLLTDSRFGPNTPLENLDEFINLLVDVRLYDEKAVKRNVPSTVLGSQELSLLDLTASYTFFANGQGAVKPAFFRSLKNGLGENIYTLLPEIFYVPLSENIDAVKKMQFLMIDVANRGTAKALLNFPYQTLGLVNCDGRHMGINGQICFGGKTGTSNDLKDNWYVGISRNFVIGVWVGYDYPESTGATGGELALPIYMDIVQQGKEELPPIEPIL
jgi:membrane peptidoglycan carboxypeptidase